MQARAMDKNFSRDWKSGDVYAPHDLSAAEARKWRKRYTPTVDAFDALSLNPIDFYKVHHTSYSVYGTTNADTYF